MSAPAYKWRPQSGIKVDAKVAGKELERIKERDGKITPVALLEDAKARNNPLHKAFEWSDTKAAHEYRLWQARHLINSIIVVVRGGNSEASKTPKRAFISVRVDKKKQYSPRAQVLSEADLRLQMVNQAIRELISWRDRYADLDELEAVHKVITTVEARIVPKGQKKAAA